MYCKSKSYKGRDDIESTRNNNTKRVDLNDYITVPSTRATISSTNSSSITDSGSSIATTINDSDMFPNNSDVIPHNVLSNDSLYHSQTHQGIRSQNSVDTYTLPIINNKTRVVSATKL